MKLPRPELGDRELLVFGECACGWRCACPEGSKWPLCPDCETQVMPTGFGTGGGWPGDHGDRLGYVAQLLGEGDAVRALAFDSPGGP
jgi:hypothetical protein